MRGESSYRFDNIMSSLSAQRYLQPSASVTSVLCEYRCKGVNILRNGRVGEVSQFEFNKLNLVN